MRTFQRSSLLVLVLLLGVVSCLMPTVSVVDPAVQATSLAQTVQVMIILTQHASGASSVPVSSAASASNTPQSPTSTLVPSQTLTPTATFTPTASPTAIVFSTVTPLVPTITVSVPSNCREGPGIVYAAVGYLLVGETGHVYARDPDGTWWYIQNPDDPSSFCWVSGKYATVSGPTAFLPIYTPMPTPTATATPPPAPSFDASFDSLVSCSPEWWPRIRLDNTGLITFRSLGIIVRDQTISESVSDSTDGFDDRPDCSTFNSKDTLLPGKHLTISAPQLSYDPTGHKLRVTVTLCSKTGQEGTCVSQTITFKP